MLSKFTSSNFVVSSRVYWNNYTDPFFNLLGCIFFSNLDCVVDNVRFLCDVSDEPKQSDIADKSYKPTKSEQCDKSADEPSHHCSTNVNRICNCTGHDCATDGDNGYYFGSNTHNDEQLHNKLSRVKYYDDVGYR
jgi:hypothetical protein